MSKLRERGELSSLVLNQDSSFESKIAEVKLKKRSFKEMKMQKKEPQVDEGSKRQKTQESVEIIEMRE